MCRFVLYLGETLTLDALLTRPTHSLINQSHQSRERPEPMNGDGFGVAWYVPTLSESPGLFRACTPAWSNANLRELARVTQSGCILAHVRAATPPLPVSDQNCHPFVAGRLAFMHNGYIPGFMGLRRKLVATLSDEAYRIIGGSTDSEHILALMVDALKKQSGVGAPALAAALRHTLKHIDALVDEAGVAGDPHLNVAVSDGVNAVVSRYCRKAEDIDSLYLHQGKAYICEDGVCRMVESEGSGSVIVSSEPLSSDPGWRPVPVNHIVSIGADKQVSLEPV